MSCILPYHCRLRNAPSCPCCLSIVILFLPQFGVRGDHRLKSPLRAPIIADDRFQFHIVCSEMPLGRVTIPYLRQPV